MRLPLPLLKVVLSTACLRQSFFSLDRAIGGQRARCVGPSGRFPRGLAHYQQHRAFAPPPVAASPLPSGGEEPVEEQEGLFISKEDINKLPIGKYEGVIHWVRPPHGVGDGCTNVKRATPNPNPDPRSGKMLQPKPPWSSCGRRQSWGSTPRRKQRSRRGSGTLPR